MQALTKALEHVGVLAVFALVLVEQAGLPFPTYPVLIVAGAWSARGGSGPERVIAAAVVACLLADLGWYATGRRFGSRVLRAMCRLSLEPDSCVADTEHLFARFGTRILMAAKFIPGLGAVTTVMSGVVEARLPGFLMYDSIGATLWAASGVMLGWIFHDAVEDVFAELAALGRAGGLLILALLLAFLILKFWRRRQLFQQLRMSRITVHELHRLREEGTPVLLVDARPSASQKRDGIIPGAITFELLLQNHQEGHGGGEAIVYCACPNEATAARIARKLMSMGYHPVRPLTGGIHAWQAAGFGIVRV
jgi:membrane protein DedA with SNARE-associated domain/rhodanese-related sulfurtransferase